MDYLSKCLCPPYLPDHQRAPNYSLTDYKEPPNIITISFESVILGTTSKQTFKIPNEDQVTHIYTVSGEPFTTPMFKAFDLKITKAIAEKGESAEVEVTYSPKVKHLNSVEYLEIKDDGIKVYTIFLKGTSVGPKVVSSIDSLFFYQTHTHKELVKTLELRNLSGVATSFHFEVNNKQEDMPLFKIDKSFGKIEPNSYFFIRVTFVATKKIGIYSQQLVCLLANNHPIIVELVGVKTNNPVHSLPKASLKHYPFKLEETEGYSGYMYDVTKKSPFKKPFSVSSIYVNFGQTYGGSFKHSSVLTMSLNNHTKNSICVSWKIYDNPIFSIKPKEITIPAGQSVVYECRYKPDVSDAMHFLIIRGTVHWSDFSIENALKEQAGHIKRIDVPIPVTLRFCGHSFPENKSWLPRLELSTSTVVLPPTLPNVFTYATFTLKNVAPLPTMFKLVSPPYRTSNFSVKPMMGILMPDGREQIFLVQLEPDLEDDKKYIEKWKIELNGGKGGCLQVTLKGYAKLPALKVGSDNTVVFDSVFPGCKDVSNVMVRNVSIHGVVYEFLMANQDEIQINPTTGYLSPNEYKILQWTLIGNIKASEITTVYYEMRAVQKGKIQMGLPLNANVTVYRKCTYSELCATPKECDVGLVRWGETLCVSFRLFNFGESRINFKLLTFANKKNVSIEPKQGTVFPKESIPVHITFEAIRWEFEEIIIGYQVCTSASFTNILDKKFFSLYSIKYTGIFPTIQVEAIVIHSFGPLFSKLALWELFNIDRLNQAFREIKNNEIKYVNMFVPDFAINEGEYTALLMLKNVTQFDTTIEIIREESCDCRPVVESRGMSRKRTVYNCCHRKMFKFCLADKHMKGNQRYKFLLATRYLEEGGTTIRYLFKLSDNRAIHVVIFIRVLPKITFKLSAYIRSMQFNLKDVYLGEKNPAVQAFTLYNNAESVVDYKFDLKTMDCLNFDYGFKIFECLNATGQLQPFCSKNIFFIFTPIEAKCYDLNIPLITKHDTYLLKIQGKGISDLKSFESLHREVTSMPHVYDTQSDNIVELSVDHLVIEHFPVWSTVEKLIFIKNHSSDRVIGYSWQPCSIKDFVDVEIVFTKGALPPAACHALVFRIRSFNRSCRLRLQIACKLLDNTQFLIHKRSVLAHRLKEKECNDQFIYTEKGLSYPKNDIQIESKPEPFYITLSVSIYITSSYDRDLHCPIEQQLSYSPQSTVSIDIPAIFQSYLSRSPRKIKQSEEPFQEEQAKMCEQTLEHILGDAIFSNMFGSAMEITRSRSLRQYYAQMSNKDIEKGKEPKELSKIKIRLVDDLLNKPQMPEVAEAFKDMMIDGLHDVFKLGPRLKGPKEAQNYVYRSTINMLTTAECDCNK